MMWGTYSCGTWKSMSCGRHGVSAQGPPKVGKRFTCTVQSMSTSFLTAVPLSCGHFSYSFVCEVRNNPPHCLGSALAWWGRRQGQETPGLGRSPLRRIIMIMIGWGWRGGWRRCRWLCGWRWLWGKVTCADECEEADHAKLVDHHVRWDVRYQTWPGQSKIWIGFSSNCNRIKCMVCFYYWQTSFGVWCDALWSKQERQTRRVKFIFHGAI